jgi:RNA polymerase sigma-70 factor (ECF subfamily)
MVSDEILMIEFQRGSRPAFDELYSRYAGPLYGFFRRRTQSPQKAEDLTQETFLAVIRGTSRYEPRALLRTYLYAIALKLLMADRRKDRNETPLPDPDAEPAIAHQPDTVVWIRNAMQKLDPSDREILMLREYEQLSYSEIADLLRIPLNTVRSRLFRSRIALKNHLEPDATLPASATRTNQQATGKQD